MFSDGYVLTHHAIRLQNFEQASIYLDACFILAFLDFEDSRSDSVNELMNRWTNEGIAKIGISNHVHGKVVHNLFRAEILNVLTLIYRKDVRKEKLSESETSQLVSAKTDRAFLDYFRSSGDLAKVERLVDGRIRRIYIGDVLKYVKTLGTDARRGLDHYYNRAADTYSQYIQTLRDDYELSIVTPPSDSHTNEIATSLMRLTQLDIYDAFHMALAVQYEYDFIATLDADFDHGHYDSALIGNTKVLKVA